MKRLLVLMLALVMLAVGAPVLAAEEQVGGDGSDLQVVYKKTTIIDFSDVTITGELAKPEGSYLMNKKKTSFNLLIRVRDNFLPEMIKTVDNL